jgi:hypothetical protein
LAPWMTKADMCSEDEGELQKLEHVTHCFEEGQQY